MCVLTLVQLKSDVEPKLIKNIAESHEGGLTGHCNPEKINTNEHGKFELLDFWLYVNGIANVLTFDRLYKAGFDLSYHTKLTENTFNVHINESDTTSTETVLDYHALAWGSPTIMHKYASLIPYVTNMKGFSKGDWQGFGHEMCSGYNWAPNRIQSLGMVRNNMIINCDISPALIVVGPNLVVVRGETTMKKIELVQV